MALMTHQLRRIYNDIINSEYGQHLWGDQTPEHTEAIVRKVNRLGIPYSMFVRLAILLWDEWCAEQGHAYPYWNIVTSDNTFEALERYMELAKDINASAVDLDKFAGELEYALSYIYWLNGEQQHRPFRPSIQASDKTKILVAEYICRLYGVAYLSSNYNDIAEAINAR